MNLLKIIVFVGLLVQLTNVLAQSEGVVVAPEHMRQLLCGDSVSSTDCRINLQKLGSEIEKIYVDISRVYNISFFTDSEYISFTVETVSGDIHKDIRCHVISNVHLFDGHIILSACGSDVVVLNSGFVFIDKNKVREL